MLQNTTYIQILIGVFLLIIGALFAGIGTLIVEHYRLKQEKLSTAYAFKGEICAILDIINDREYIDSLNKMIDRHKQALYELKNVYGSQDLLISLSIIYNVRPLLSFSFSINEDIFFVKKKLGNKIGLLDNATEKIISFYGYANSFLLDIENNAKKNDEYEKLLNNDNGLEKTIKYFQDYYKTYNIPYMVQNNIGRHEEMLKIAKRIIKTGDESIEGLDAFISKQIS